MTEATNIQTRILNKATKDYGFSQFINKLEVDVFEGNKYYEDAFSALTQYYREHKSPATKDLLETYLLNKLDRRNIDEGERLPYKEAINEIYTVDTTEDGQVFDGLINDFIYEKRFMNAQKILALSGGTKEAMNKFDASYKQMKKDATLSDQQKVIDFADESTSELVAEYIENINTGIIDIPLKPYQVATGGLAKGEMGIIGADTGAGKSLAMVSLAIEYVLSGKDVVYFDLEERQARKFMRFYRAFLGRISIELGTSEDVVKQLVPTQEAATMIKSGNFNKLLDAYAEKTGRERGHLYFTKYMPHELTTSGLKQAMENITMVDGKNADIIFVDYPDLLRINTGEDMYRAVGLMFEELRAIAQEYEAVMWTATQLGRRGKDASDIRTGNDIQGSIQKKNAAEFVGIINLKDDERESGFGRIYIDKNRNGGNTGELIPFKVDRLTGLVRAENDLEEVQHQSILANNKTKLTKEDIGMSSNAQKNEKIAQSGVF